MVRLFRYFHALAGTCLDRRYPPGRLNYFSSVHRTNRRFLLDRKARLGPIFKQWSGGKVTTVFVSHERARRFLTENNGSLPCATIDLKMLFPHGWLREMDGELHRRYRRILSEAIQSARWSTHEDEIRVIIRGALETIALVSNDGSANLACIRAAFRDAATQMMFRLLFGVTSTHPRFEALRQAYRAFGPDGPVTRIKSPQVAAFGEIRSIVEELGQEICEQPGRFPPCALKRLVETGAIDDPTALGHLIYTFEASHFDTYSLWLWILKHLSDNPSAVEAVRPHVSAPGPGRRKYAEAVVCESLRTDQSEALVCRVEKDIDFDGYRIARGGLARICLWEVHKDPEAFEEPFRYDPQRFVDRTYDSNRFSPFGLDKHHCVGAGVVVPTSALMVEELLSGYAWSVVGDGPAHRGRFHWEPGPGFAIRMRPRHR